MFRASIALVPAVTMGVILCAATPRAGEIHEAAIDGNVERVAQLLDEGADPNAPDDAGTPLHWALFGQQAATAKLLLERGADPDAVGPSGSALFAAADGGLVEIVALLLEHGADPNLGEKATPLIAAAKRGNLEMTDLLLSHGADAGFATPDRLTALHEAARNGHREVAVSLLEQGADVNALTSSGRPPIHYAAESNHADLVATLREHGARPGEIAPIAQLLVSANIAKGEKEAEVCLRCHPVDPETTGLIGSHFWNLVGRPRNSVPGFDYSPALAGLEGNWTYEALNAFIARPTEVHPGTRMDFAGIAEPERRADLIAFLRTLSDDPIPLP